MARRIAYVLKRFPRISETFVAAELIELQRQGEQVTVYALSRPEEPFNHGFLSELHARVVYLPHRPLHQLRRTLAALARTLRRNPRGWLRALAAKPPTSLVRWRRLLQATVLYDELRRDGIDHAHAHFATTAAELCHLVRLMGGPSYSVTAHAKDIYHESVSAEDLREVLGPARFTATVTRHNQAYLQSILGAQSPVQLVPNAVDLRRFPFLAERPVEPGLILAVARLVEKKGLSDLIRACAILKECGVPHRLELIGDGPLRGELEAQARDAGIAAAFRGALPQEEVFDAYARAAVFCLPCIVASTGDRDGLPTAVLEAMAFGVPVVVTSVNGLADVVRDGEVGVLVPQGDPAALAQALERLLRDWQLAARLAVGGRRQIERRYSLEQSVRRLRDLLPEVPA